MKALRKSKAAGLAVITAVYILASVSGIALYNRLSYPLWANLLIADAGATLLVFFFSLLLRNASVYDPYWSVQPIVILTAFVISKGTHINISSAAALLLISVWAWGARLTANWVYTFNNLEWQDWRYSMLKEKTGILYPAVNLLGIHMFPTLIVYLCVLPAVYAMEKDLQATRLSYLGMAVCIFSVSLQFVSDVQMHSFRRRGAGGLIREGLWKYSRHPNYLGEILMWWGIALQALCVLPDSPLLAAGATANTAMFLFISIPMADKRQAQKEGYEEYRNATRALLPLKKGYDSVGLFHAVGRGK